MLPEPSKETEVGVCPQCDRRALSRVCNDCQLYDGTVIHSLARFHCSQCGADFFDLAAMREIRKQRGKKKHGEKV